MMGRAGKPGIATTGIVLLAACLALAGCQQTTPTKAGGSAAIAGPTTPAAAEAAYYSCVDTALRGTVRSVGTPQNTAGRFLNRCSGELSDWRQALIDGGMPAERAAQFTNDVRDALRDEIAAGLRPV